jgi:hypothetical protein
VSACGLGCDAASDCNDGSGCTTDSCAFGVCQNVAASSELMNFTFTDAIDGWTASGGGLGVAWRESGAQVRSAPLSMYFGNAASTGYCASVTAAADLPGDATTTFPNGTITFDASLATVVRFDVWLDLRSGADVDQLDLRLRRPDGTETVVWTKAAIPASAYGAWVPVTVDLTAYAPFTGKLRFQMAVGSTIANGSCFGGDGVFIDDVRVVRTCGGL